MKRRYYLGILWTAALVLGGLPSLGAEDQAPPPEKSGTKIQVQPSSDIRYPQAKDVLNPQSPVKPAPAASPGTAPSGTPLWGSTPVPVTDGKAAKPGAGPVPGWYLQAPASGTPEELQVQASALGQKLPPGTSRGVWLQNDGKTWSILVGPWTAPETADLLKMINTGKAPAENLALIRR